jgi:antitoxin HicB
MRTPNEYLEYVFIIEQLDDGTFDVDFPDIPEIITGGESIDEAYHNAREALELHLDSLRELGRPLPKKTRKLAVVDA